MLKKLIRLKIQWKYFFFMKTAILIHEFMIPILLQWILCIAPMELNCSKIWLETQNSHKECLVRTKWKLSRKQQEHHDSANISLSYTFKWAKSCIDEVAASFINNEHKIYSALILMQETLIKVSRDTENEESRLTADYKLVCKALLWTAEAVI